MNTEAFTQYDLTPSRILVMSFSSLGILCIPFSKLCPMNFPHVCKDFNLAQREILPLLSASER